MDPLAPRPCAAFVFAGPDLVFRLRLQYERAGRCLSRSSRGERVNAGAEASLRWRRVLPWLGALIGLAVLAWLLRRFDLDQFLTILGEADVRYVMLVPLAIAAEQL